MKRVLVVEDEKEIRRGICAMVRRAPVPVEEVLECRGGAEALAVLHRCEVDVMFTDIRMPGVDGIQLVQEAGGLPNPPLMVVVSGYDDFSYAVEMMRHGVRDYILKPVEREKIFALLADMEEELAARRREQDDRHAAGRELVRGLMLGGMGAGTDRPAAVQQCAEELPDGPYAVVCLPPKAALLPSFDKHPGVRRMGEMEGHGVLLLSMADLAPLQDALAEACAGVGGVHTGPRQLHAAYCEAAAARCHAFVQGRMRQFEEGDVPASSVGADTGLTEQVAHLLGAFDAKGAQQVLGQALLRAQNGSMEPAALVGCLQALPGRIGALYGRQAPERESLAGLGEVWAWRSAYEQYLALCAWMDDFCAVLQEGYEDDNRRKIHEAVLFLRENYRAEIDMAVVSNHVSMNYTQFSHLFKLYAGANFLDYLKALRLEESRRLLAETDLRVREVAHRAGFKNDKHFMKAFKQSLAVSPTEYRRNLRHAGEG